MQPFGCASSIGTLARQTVTRGPSGRTMTTPPQGLLRAVGFMRGRLLRAHQTLTHLRITDDEGSEVFAHNRQTSERWVMGWTRFVGECVVVPKVSSTACHGLWAWDVWSGRETLNVDFPTECGPFAQFASIPRTTVFLAPDPAGIGVWDVATGRCRRRVRADHVLAAGLHPRTRRLAYSTRGSLHVLSEVGLPPSRWDVARDWGSLAWGLDGRVLVGVPVNSDALVVDPESGETVHTFPVLGDILATSADGRWVAFERGFVDLQSMTVREHDARAGGTRHAQAAAYDAASNQFAFAGGPFVWRVPV